jgi:hypothetical protein
MSEILKLNRQRKQGNFLFEIYSNSSFSLQSLLKERIVTELSKQHWENFLRTQTHTNKKKDFHAEIIGICAKTLITDVMIWSDTSLTDLAKLSAFWAEMKKSIETESMV